MVSKHYSIEVGTKGEEDFINITSEVARRVVGSSIEGGIVTVTVRSTTSSVIICEDEPGLLEDMRIAIRRLAPSEVQYMHDEAWHDDNGRSHIKASLSGQGVVIPVVNSSVLLGRWQSVFLVEFDVRPRTRIVDVVVVG